MGRLRSFGRSEEGQISFLMLFGAVAFVGLLGLVMTTGDQAAQKIGMQNAVDAAALSGGAWIARGLNLTSAINVVQTQLVGGAILLNALADALIFSIAPVELMIGAYAACTPFVPLCAVLVEIVAVQLEILLPLAEAVGHIATALADCSTGVFWLAARALESLNAGINATFFFIAALEAFDAARTDGAEFAVLLPGPLLHGKASWKALTLPTRKGTTQDLCRPMEEGSPAQRERGYSPLLRYPVGQGPYSLGKCRLSWATALVTGFPPVGPALFSYLAEQEKNRVCGGTPASSGVEIMRPSRDLDECLRLKGKATWRWVQLDIGEEYLSEDGCQWLDEHIGSTGIEDYDTLPSSGVVKGPKEETHTCDWVPPGRAINPGTYCKREFSQHTHIPGEGDRLTDPPLFLNTIDIWQLVETSVEDRINVPPPSASAQCKAPDPYVLAAEDDALHYLAIARRHNRRVFFTERFLEEPPTFYTYGQVEIYNGISADTFTQDWRVRLAPAKLVEAPLHAVVGALPDGMEEALSFFDLDLAAYKNLLSRVNNH